MDTSGPGGEPGVQIEAPHRPVEIAEPTELFALLVL
jgi:hypothetical protein